MSEPANPPSEDVAGRDVPDTPPHAEPPAGADEAGARPTAAAELAEPEPPIALRPPNARPTPPPLEADTVRIVIVGTTLWFVGFLVLLPFRGRLADDGREFWLWTCLAGGLLGLLGLFLARRAASAAARRRGQPSAGG
ncbi:MAG TPA: DUF2530 domain-containing protein [Mycobacteriales bacterium]|nr:DUF2530 domain-containing protein [Mycobacteriales bacterium]